MIHENLKQKSEKWGEKERNEESMFTDQFRRNGGSQQSQPACCHHKQVPSSSVNHLSTTFKALHSLLSDTQTQTHTLCTVPELVTKETTRQNMQALDFFYRTLFKWVFIGSVHP